MALGCVWMLTLFCNRENGRVQLRCDHVGGAIVQESSPSPGA